MLVILNIDRKIEKHINRQQQQQQQTDDGGVGEGAVRSCDGDDGKWWQLSVR